VTAADDSESASRRAELRIANRLEEMEKVVGLIDAFAAAHEIPGQVADALNLVLDEVLNNIISYGYGKDAPGTIVVRLVRAAGAVHAEIEDDAAPFEWPVPGPLDRTVPRAERKPGGAGLRFIHGLMDTVAHDRVGGRNRLRLTKRIPLVS